MSIYWFSVIGNIHVIFIGIGIVIVVVGTFFSLFLCAEENETKTVFVAFVAFIIVIILGIIPLSIGVFVPTQNSLIKSYICIKGKEQLTNKNINKLIEAIDDKTNKLIETFKNKEDTK